MKNTRPTCLNNLDRGVLVRGAPLVLPALLAILALAGVTVTPVIGIADARAELERTRLRVLECRDARARNDLHATERTEERANATFTALRRTLPSDCSNLVAHSAVRMAAAHVGLELARLDIGLERDTHLERTVDSIAVRDVVVGGSATVADIQAFVECLRELGFPSTLHAVSLERRSDGATFEFRLELGLLHFSALERAGQSGEETEERP